MHQETVFPPLEMIGGDFEMDYEFEDYGNLIGLRQFETGFEPRFFLQQQQQQLLQHDSMEAQQLAQNYLLSDQTSWLNRSVNLSYQNEQQQHTSSEQSAQDISSNYSYNNNQQRMDSSNNLALRESNENLSNSPPSPNASSTKIAETNSTNPQNHATAIAAISQQPKQLRTVDWQITPIVRTITPRELYLLYGDVFIEIDGILQNTHFDFVLDRNHGISNFKRLHSVRHRLDNKYTELVGTSISSPLREFDFLIEKISRIPNQAAQDLTQILTCYQQLVRKQTMIDNEFKQKYSQELLEMRSAHCNEMSEGIIGELDENASVFYCQLQLQPQTLDMVFLKHGYSSRLAWIFGCSPDVLGMLYMRYGQLDITRISENFEMQLRKAMMHFKYADEELAQVVQDFDAYTIEGYMIPTKLIISKIILSKEFDEQHGIQGIMPECLLIIDAAIDIKWVQMLARKRCQHSIEEEQEQLLDQIQQYSKVHQLKENYEYLQESSEFLNKYYPEMLHNKQSTVFKSKNNRVSRSQQNYQQHQQQHQSLAFAGCSFDQQIDRIISLLESQQQR